jgi:hypothetical protein
MLAYAPLVEALRPLDHLLAPGELERVLGGARGELARLVPELAPAPDPTAPRGADGPGVPGRLFELLLGVLHRLAEPSGLLVVAEDLHWADQSTRDLLGFLHRNLPGPVALVLTYRSDELHRRHPLRPFLAELERAGHAERLELGRLGRRPLAALLANILGEPPAAALVEQVEARSGGNPFFAEELLAAHQDGTRLPEALRELVLARVGTLPEATQGVLQVAAVAGTRVDHQLLAAVVGLDAGRLVELLREAVGRHLLVPDQASGAYAFRHALVAEAVYDDLLPVQRGPLHAAYARALEQRVAAAGREASAAELGQLAHHWLAAQDQGRARLASVRAGEAAEAGYALAEAVAHYERALSLWDHAPEAAASSPLDRGSLLHRAAEAANLAGYDDRAVTLGRLALDRVDAAAEPLRAGALLERLARYHWTAAHTPLAMAAVERAVAIIPTEPHANLATVLDWGGHAADAAEVFLAGVDLARQFGALGRYGPTLLGDAAGSMLSLGRREEAERLLDRAFDLDLRSPALRLRPLTVRGALRVRAGDLAGARADFRQVLDEAPAPPDPQNAAPVFAGLAEAALWDGGLADARAAVADGLQVLAGAEEPYWMTELCRVGLAVEAAAAEQARSRRADAEELAARELAAGLLDRARAATTAPNVVPTPIVAASVLTAEAEWSRASGPGDPERWARSARAWEALGYPWQAGYARWRQAEALLATGAPRDAAGAALAKAWTAAGGLGARLLAAEVESLARRARIELAPPRGGQPRRGRHRGAPAAPHRAGGRSDGRHRLSGTPAASVRAVRPGPRRPRRTAASGPGRP